MLIDRANHCLAEHQELHVIVRAVAWIEQVPLRSIAQRPVDVLA